MNTWEIIKNELTRKSKPGTFGRDIDVNIAADVFFKIKQNLKDEGASMEAFNSDDEVRKAILCRKSIDELYDAGIIS
jgi:hypothetical protein